MRILLDTHSLLWFLTGDDQLSANARRVIEDASNEVAVSAGSLWEIAIKLSLDKLTLGRPYDELFPAQLEQNSIDILQVHTRHLAKVAELPFHHRDPFDRLLVAQALIEDMIVVGADDKFDAYGVERIW